MVGVISQNIFERPMLSSETFWTQICMESRIEKCENPFRVSSDPSQLKPISVPTLSKLKQEMVYYTSQKFEL